MCLCCIRETCVILPDRRKSRNRACSTCHAMTLHFRASTSLPVSGTPPRHTFHWTSRQIELSHFFGSRPSAKIRVLLPHHCRLRRWTRSATRSWEYSEAACRWGCRSVSWGCPFWAAEEAAVHRRPSRTPRRLPLRFRPGICDFPNEQNTCFFFWFDTGEGYSLGRSLLGSKEVRGFYKNKSAWEERKLQLSKTYLWTRIRIEELLGTLDDRLVGESQLFGRLDEAHSIASHFV